MPSKSSGRITKAYKNSTPHQKNHRFETFTNKIAKFNSLQPLRKVRRHDLDNEDDSAATSYFRTGLQKWSELNISKGFVSFKREVLSLSESLPQILHFEKRIMESLAKYISMHDKEALEPLLDLLTAFAHDLGVRFEKHYPRSLGLIVDIAGRPQDADVIEWTFAALAFLFKYLSKLLVPNLLPTFDTVSPLMGKTRHPPHIARFAAEALSFLVKKAGAPSHRATSLPSFVAHVKSDLSDLAGDRQFTLYQDGVMTMFAEAMKGNENTLHSAGPAIFVALLDSAFDDDEPDSSTATRNDIWSDVVCGVLTSVIHHSTSTTFAELEEAILQNITSGLDRFGDDGNWWTLRPYIKVLGTMAGVRKGSRVSSWSGVTDALVGMLEKISKRDDDAAQKDPAVIWRDILVPTAITLHHAPLEAVVSPMEEVPGYLMCGPLMRCFIPFCSYFCDLNASRFGSMLRADFQKFIAGHWSQSGNQDLLCVLIPRMIGKDGFAPPGRRGSCTLPQAWQDQIVSKFENLEISPFPERGPYNKDPQVWRDECLPKYSALLRLLELTTVHPSTNARIAELLLRKLKLALRPSSTLASDEVHFIVSQGFHAYLRMSKPGKSVDASLSPLLRAAVPRFARSVGFLEAYIAYEEHLQESDGSKDHDEPSSDGSTLDEDPVMTSLVENLCSPSHEIRLSSLKLLKRMNHLGELANLVDNMIEIEQLPLSLSHVRTIAMLLRNLGQKYSSLDESTWLHRGVPSFLFGMLTVKLSPVWDNATESLGQICQTRTGEEVVSNLAFKWLAVPSPRWTPSTSDNLASNRRVVTYFDCTLLNSLQRQADEVCNVMDTAVDIMLRDFDEQQRTPDALAPNARTRALKVFNALPSVAEKRSRRLVPHFLPWALEDQASLPDDVEFDHSYWSLADRKAILGVISQFINPRVLYLHEKVYDGLLELMENGDVEFQKLTLKAILAWKQEGVKPYQENLEFLLDDARLKNELTVFLQGEIVKPEHRAELMPVLLRLLYGRSISKKGAASGKHGLQATRLTILRNLTVKDTGAFLDIASGKLSKVRVINTSTARDKLFAQPIIPPRKQVGFLNMASSLISELGTNVMPYMETLLNTVLYCTVFASRQLTGMTADAPDLDPEDTENAGSHSLHRITRSTGIKCLITLFQNAQGFQWEPYHGIIVEEIVVPRLENLPTEMSQGVSGVLQLLSTWSALPRVALFLGPHGHALPQGILPKVIECLAAEKAKDEVRVFILGMIRNLVRLAQAPAEESEFNELIQVELLDSNAEAMLGAVTFILRTLTASSDLLEAGVEALLSLAGVLREPRCIESVLQICSFLLKQPPRRVSPKTKGRLLLVVENFVALVDTSEHRELCNDVYDTLASLFSYFRDRENRQALCRALAVVSKNGSEGEGVDVAEICAGLNSYKEGRIDEPDYDRRLASFNAISGDREVPLTPREWLPLLHNCLFFIKVDEEFGVLSTNSADAMRRFVQDAVRCSRQCGSTKVAFQSQLTDILMPAIYAGARELSDTTRREILRVFGFILRSMPEWESVKDMGGLLADIEEDAADPPFFFNILSPAVSRQLEALQVLEKANAAQEIGSQNIAQFFIPLLEHFLFDREEGGDDRGLSAQATNVIGEIAKSLHWKHYRTTLQRYISYVASKPDHQKQTIRLLGKFTDALVSCVEGKPADSMEVDEVGDGSSSSTVRRLTLTVPKQEQLSTEIANHFLPTLMKHLHEKDESEVSYRVPVGVTIVKLLRLLPPDDMKQRLAGVLTDICHILRSKATESRDMARDTLVQIATILGSSFIGFILRELRGALTKGYQLHVLSYTVHSILVAVIPGFEPGDLDYCIPSIVNVIMDDIFGVIGQEKDAEGYITQMKEVKSSKSQDSMELVANNASITRLIDLVHPLQALLMQKVDLKMIRKIDILLGRISTGLLRNRAAESRDTLVFCYEVIQSVYRSREPEAPQKLDPRVRKYLVQKGAKKGDRGQTSRHMYKLFRFALDTLRSMFKKHDSLRTPENLSGFIPLLGDAIIEGEDEVKVSAFRLLAVITRVPFEGDEGTNIYKVAVKEAAKSVSTSVSTTTDLSQAALKMLAVVLRDRRDVVIKDHAVDMLLGKLRDDLTEPQYRHVTFNFLRSVLERKVETADVYDTMDYVGTVMITNDDKDTRDLARGAFFQFIREYPQKKARWEKQLEFIIANLKYDREGGRLSVMEMVHLLLMKSSDDFVQEVAASCFLPLFMVLANDESDKCKLAASELLRETFRRASKERASTFLAPLRQWLDNNNLSVVRLALLVWSYYFESHDGADKNEKDFKLAYGKIMELLGAEDLGDVDGYLVEAALSLVNVLLATFPKKILSSASEDLWTHVGRCMGHPHPSVKLAAIKLISLYLNDFAQNMDGSVSGQKAEAVGGSYGLTLGQDKVEDLVRLALNILNGHEVDEALATEAGQILIFLGPRLPTPTAVVEDVHVDGVKAGEQEDEDEDDGDERKEDEEQDQETQKRKREKDLQYLFWRLSHILRKEIRPRAAAIVPKTVAMEVLETVCRRSSTERLGPCFKTILAPLHNLTDSTIRPPQTMDDVFTTRHEHVKTRAQILMDSLQKKFGTAEYSRQLLDIREEVRDKRQARAAKRKIEAITQPEKHGRDKRKKFEKNRERKKVRSSEQKASRQAYKNW
ncbi:U3 small nucleolar RNA-associated protein 20 [Geosmithia morbida]|uniref:U3 small nucleolar RNA-associated protein 20 n=1 Tax=Geosmithia morbida TaxID=1094350 RepID=A0A9P4YZK7_9HYPO|nr:U3 small nucleolar RNA-associated protein 20 [Geosmithia morbida]KAF4123929.1 U3 small nucleolar RNA-associated protein 20 [Geosmithia morbida]